MSCKRQKTRNDNANASPPISALSIFPVELWRMIFCAYLPVDRYSSDYRRRECFPVPTIAFRFQAARLRCVCRAFAQIVDTIAARDLTLKNIPSIPYRALPCTAVRFTKEAEFSDTTRTALALMSLDRVTSMYNVNMCAFTNVFEAYHESDSLAHHIQHIQFTHETPLDRGDTYAALSLLNRENLLSLDICSYMAGWDFETWGIDLCCNLQKLALCDAHEPPSDRGYIVYCIAENASRWPRTIRDFTLQSHDATLCAVGVRGMFDYTDYEEYRAKIKWPLKFCAQLERLNLARGTEFPLNACANLHCLTLTTSEHDSPWALVDVALPQLRTLSLFGKFEFSNDDIGTFAPHITSLTFQFAKNVLHGPKFAAEFASIWRIASLEHITIDAPDNGLVPHAMGNARGIQSLRIRGISMERLDWIPASVEVLDIYGRDIAGDTRSTHNSLRVDHLKSLRRLIIRDSIALKPYRTLHVPDSLHVIELFAHDREHNFYTDFPLVVPTTVGFHPPLTFIARYDEKNLPKRRAWKKTIVHAPRVAVRNELACPSDYVMCIEPQ